jgi:hypothetical protein
MSSRNEPPEPAPGALIDEPAITLRPSLGATLPPEHVIGRDHLVDKYWTLLKNGNNLLLLAPRRIGKTSICTLLSSRSPDDFIVSYIDVESCRSGQAFVDQSARYASEALDRGKAHLVEKLPFLAARRIKKIELGEIVLEVDVQVPVEDELRRTLESLEASCEKLGVSLVLLWDELPWFVDKLVKRDAHDDAIAVLDGLRAYRQQHPRSRLRMIYTGSIGLFEVLDRLRESKGYGAKPTNDMSPQEVPFLDTDGARALVGALVWDIERSGVQERQFVEYAAERCEGHPFVIQWLANELWLIDSTRPMGREEVDRILDELATSDADPLDLEHYVQRLEEYGWGADARTILNIIAPRGERGATVDNLDNLLPRLDRDRIVDVLRRLRRDGYVTQRDGRSRFRMLLLARWWAHRHQL